jgi:hypothetical protein
VLLHDHTYRLRREPAIGEVIAPANPPQRGGIDCLEWVTNGRADIVSGTSGVPLIADDLPPLSKSAALGH